MITKNDIILLLAEMRRDGEDTTEDTQKVLNSSSIPLDVLKKINSKRQLDLTKFYTKIRKSYNQKKSKLYINIMQADENAEIDSKITLTTLSALLNQILQFKADDRTMFYQHSRAEEILEVLNIYFKSYNLIPATKLLHLIKCDIKASEELEKL